ncbi:MAG: hypoxanthine phosphoribosyltransferase [Bacteroidales bacterium]|nr:hypoxanthine phosphoribosyltransferase [Bacteroidales bacterium]
MECIKLKGKVFGKYLSYEEIQKTVKGIAEKINSEFKDKKPVFLVVLNGSFLFFADLIKHIDFECEISFVKIASYSGTKSTDEVKCLIGINENLKGRNVIIIEDIIDAGSTIDDIIRQLKEHKPAEIKVVSLFFKPDSFVKDFKIDIAGRNVPNDFLIGYGLDYDGLGRNLKDVYKLKIDN